MADSPITQKLKGKALEKQKVFTNTKKNFKRVKVAIKTLVQEIEKELDGADSRIRLKYEDRGAYDARVWVGGDVLIFHMHTNVFQFEPEDQIWELSYLRNNPNMGYCGVINIFNFLADSFTYNRVNDTGYLLSRLLINKQDHYMVQGKNKLGLNYNNFINNTLDGKQLKAILEEVILQALEFEMYIPPLQQVNLVTVDEMKQMSSNLKLKTAKRMGFKLQSDIGQKFRD